MLNLKLALGALAAEIASWSSLWLLRSQSDAALLGYLMAHGLASGLLALCLAPFLATSARSVRQRLALVALMGLFAYAVPGPASWAPSWPPLRCTRSAVRAVASAFR